VVQGHERKRLLRNILFDGVTSKHWNHPQWNLPNWNQPKYARYCIMIEEKWLFECVLLYFNKNRISNKTNCIFGRFQYFGWFHWNQPKYWNCPNLQFILYLRFYFDWNIIGTTQTVTFIKSKCDILYLRWNHPNWNQPNYARLLHYDWRKLTVWVGSCDISIKIVSQFCVIHTLPMSHFCIITLLGPTRVKILLIYSLAARCLCHWRCNRSCAPLEDNSLNSCAEEKGR